MFNSYLFVNHAIDKTSYVEIVKTRGLVRILGERWDRLVPVGEEEIDALQRLEQSDLHVMPYPYLHEGQRVRVRAGLLAGVEGILLRKKPKHGVLVLSVDVLSRSVAVEVDCTLVTPVTTAAALARTSSKHGAWASA